MFTLILTGIILPSTPPACHAGPVVAEEAFNDTTVGLNGWEQAQMPANKDDPIQVKYRGAGGNKDGFARFKDASGDSTYLSAPGKTSFVGDYTTAGIKAISYDHKVIQGTLGAKLDHYEVILEGKDGLTATWLGPREQSTTFTDPSDKMMYQHTGWVNVTVPLTGFTSDHWNVEADPNGKLDSAQVFADILSDVKHLYIRIEGVDNSGVGGVDIDGIDNIVVKTTVPEPGSLALAGVTLGGVCVESWRRWRKRGVTPDR
jgi:hypothetical protein